MSVKTALNAVAPYITRDGSEIRELLHPSLHAVRNQSLAEAVIPPGAATLLHRPRPRNDRPLSSSSASDIDTSTTTVICHGPLPTTPTKMSATAMPTANARRLTARSGAVGACHRTSRCAPRR